MAGRKGRWRGRGGGSGSTYFWAELGARTIWSLWNLAQEGTKNKTEERQDNSQAEKEDDQVYLYYYASQERAVNVLLERRIPVSRSYVEDDRSSDGVFLTATPPKRIAERLDSHEATVQRLLAAADRENRTWCFEFRKRDLPGVRKAPLMGPDIWLYPRDLHLNGIYWELLAESDD